MTTAAWLQQVLARERWSDMFRNRLPPAKIDPPWRLESRKPAFHRQVKR